MPKIILPDDTQYSTSDETGWRWWRPRMDTLGDEGWKIHASGISLNAQAIANALLPLLIEMGVAHKILETTEEADAQTGEQTGKLIAIYPDSVMEAFMVVDAIDRALVGVNWRQSPVIPIAKHVGNTILYTRYGAYVDKVKNPQGKYEDDPKKFGKLKPDWIVDPWNNYPNPNLVMNLAPFPKHDNKVKYGFAKRGARKVKT